MSFLRAAALRRWISRSDQPDEVKAVSTLLAKSFPPGRGTHHENNLIAPEPSDEMEMPRETPRWPFRICKSLRVAESQTIMSPLDRAAAIRPVEAPGPAQEAVADSSGLGGT